MRNLIENGSLLQKQMNDLQLEKLYIRSKLKMKWQIYFMPGFGEGRMYMQREVRIRRQEKQVTLLNVITSGRDVVRKSINRK